MSTAMPARRSRSKAATDFSIVNKVENSLINPDAPATKDIDGNIDNIHEFALNVVQTISDGKMGIRRHANPQQFVEACVEGIHRNIDEISGTKLRDFATGVGHAAGREIAGVALRTHQPVTYRTEYKTKEGGGGLRRYKEEITINCDSTIPELKLEGPDAEEKAKKMVNGGIAVQKSASGTVSGKRTRIEEGEGEFGTFARGGDSGNTSVKRYKTASYSDYITEDESDREESLQGADSREASTEPIVEIPETPPITSRFGSGGSGDSSRFYTSSSYSHNRSSISPRTSLSPRPFATASVSPPRSGSAGGVLTGSRFSAGRSHDAAGHGHSHSHSSGHRVKAGRRSGSPEGSEESDGDEGDEHFLRSKHCMHKDIDYAE